MSKICDELRASILQAAMQGKLTKQLVEDGNAEVFLDLVNNEKEKLIENGIIKKQKHIEPITEEPFNIPESWKWVQLGDLVYVFSGLAYKKNDLDVKINNEVIVLRGGNIVDMAYTFKPDDVKIDRKFIPKNNLYLKKNQLVTPAVTSQSNLGKIARIDDDYNNVVAGGFVLNIVPYVLDDDFSKLFCYFFSSPYIKEHCGDIANKSGQAFYNLNRTKLQETAFPLPPLAEQKRIVAKVDELMARVADLEKSADALASLKSHYPDEMRASLLQAAMQGKLTKQLPEDGDAKELLKEIMDEREKFYKKQKELPISEDEILFEIPDSWCWQKLENISTFIGDKNNQIKESLVKKEGKYKVVSQSKELFVGYYDDERKLLKIDHPVLVFGDHTALVKYIDFDFIIGADGVKIINPICMDIKYLYYALRYLLIGINELGGYSRHYKYIKDKLIPIPPLAEQKRIVERLDEAMNNINVVAELIASE